MTSGIKNELLVKLTSLFGSEPVAQVYLTLLSKGPATIEKLMEGLKFEREQLNDILNCLVLVPLISFSLNRERRTVFYSLDPQYSLRSILTRNIWLISDSLHSPSDIGNIQGRNGDRLSFLQDLIGKLVQLCSEVYKPSLTVDFGGITVGSKREQMASYISDIVSKSKVDILALVSPPHLLGNIVWQAIVNRLECGVKYKRITSFNEILRHGFEITKREASTNGISLYFTDDGHFDQKFYVVDSEYVAFFSPMSLKSFSDISGQVVHNKGISRKFANEFEKKLSEAIPASFVMEMILPVRLSLIDRARTLLSSDHFDYFLHVVNSGVFSTFANRDSAKIALDVAADSGLLVYADELYYPAYKLDFAELRDMWKSKKERQKGNDGCKTP